MPIQLLINNGSGDRDYIRYTLPESISVDDNINVPTLTSFTLVRLDNQFQVPRRNAYVKVFSTKFNRYLATGLVTNDPEREVLGVAGGGASGSQFKHFLYRVHVTSDEYLLNLKSVPFTPAFVNQGMGQILARLAETLAPGYFNTTSFVASGDLVPYFEYDPSRAWSDYAKEFADASRYRYKVINKTLYFQQFGDASLGIEYDETKGEGSFDPYNFSTDVVSLPVLNDVIVVGGVEPQTNWEDNFVGDGFTSAFELKHPVFRGATSLLLQDDWTGPGFSVDLWNIVDPQSKISLQLGSLVIEGGNGALDQTYVLGRNGIELGGQVYLQHGEFRFNDSSTGILGGLYTGGGSAGVASDDFNRTDANPIGGNWSTIGGASNPMQIVSNQARGSTAGSAFNASYWNAFTWPDDQYSEAAMIVGPGSNFPGVGVRISAVAQTGYFGFAEGVGGAGTLYIQRRLAGAAVNLISTSNTTNSGDVLKLEVRGTTLTLYVNGVQKLQTTDANIASGSAGIVAVAGVVSNAIVDNWAGGSLSGVLGDCIAGFDVRPSTSVVVTASGASGILIQPFRLGSLVGPQITTKANHRYVLQTLVNSRTWSRWNRTYRTLAGTPFGGQAVDGTADLTWMITDIDVASPTSPTVVKHSVTGVQVPAFALYAPVNSASLKLAMNYTLIALPPQGTLAVRSLYGPTGGMLPVEAPGPEILYPLGFGMQNQVATISRNGDVDTLQFYADTIPAVGARIRLQTWESGASVARVRDPDSVAQEAALVGDDGVRSSILSTLRPQPRTSEECEIAAKAAIFDRLTTKYQGAYTFLDYFLTPTVSKAASGNLADYPRTGRYLRAHAPARAVENQQFLVTHVTMVVVEPREETVGFSVGFGPDTYLERLLVQFVDRPESVLASADVASRPLVQTLVGVGTTYLQDLKDARFKGTTGSSVLLDVSVPPTSGVEIRLADSGWAVSALNLVAIPTTKAFFVPRTSRDQTFFVRMVNGAKFSRFSKALRVVYPLIPGSPVLAGLDVVDQLHPNIIIDFGSAGVRDIYAVEIRDSDNTTVLYQKAIGGPSDLRFIYDNSVVKRRDFTFYCYFMNLLREYSPALVVTFAIPEPRMVVAMDEQATGVVSVPAEGVPSFVDVQVFPISGANLVVPIRNPDFEESASLPPPGWTEISGAASYDAVPPYAGARSVRVTNNSGVFGGIRSEFFGVAPGETYKLSVAIRRIQGTGNDAQIQFVDSAGSFLGSVSVPEGVSGVWVYKSNSGLVPASAVKGYVWLQANNVNGNICDFDNIVAEKIGATVALTVPAASGTIALGAISGAQTRYLLPVAVEHVVQPRYLRSRGTDKLGTGPWSHDVLKNKGFESGSKNWAFGDVTQVSIVTDASEAHLGQKYCKIVATSDFMSCAAITDDGTSFQFVEVVPGDVVLWGGWAYRQSGDRSARFIVGLYDENLSNAAFFGVETVSPAVWTYLSAKVVVPAGKKYVRFLTDVGAGSTMTTARFDDVFCDVVRNHVYAPKGVVSFDNINNIESVGSPPGLGQDPTYGEPFEPIAPAMRERAWSTYVREIMRLRE